MRRWFALSVSRSFFLIVCLTVFSTAGFGAEMYTVEYLCADWGPAMTLPSKAGEKPKFDESQEEIYFLKQVGGPNGIRIYLCQMKPDGSEKTEIKELWHNPNYPIDTQGQTTWMDVNAKTRKIALSITYAGSDVTGLWTVNLDGTGLRHLITPSMVNGYLRTASSPSWTPDGQWIVYCESLRGSTNAARIARCDSHGSNTTYLTDGPADGEPRVSPDGTKIAYIVISRTKGGLWLMSADGTSPHVLPNPADTRKGWHGGIDPSWSPDGKSIYLSGITCLILDSQTGGTILAGQPICMGKRYTPGCAHWGRLGFVGSTVGGILVTDAGLHEAKPVGITARHECDPHGSESCRW